jgi:hypothetical protein
MIQSDRIPYAAGTLLPELTDNNNILISCAYDAAIPPGSDETFVIGVSQADGRFLVQINS